MTLIKIMYYLKTSEHLLEYMEKPVYNFAFVVGAIRVFSVAFKHRNLPPSVLHMALNRSFQLLLCDCAVHN